ncbi:phosphopantetheine-binding protein [Streptomyces sp. S.PNR 29]|uniref:phosphopantetheine-binding protein n=1 Tax=Streptomyces sp. S.PNR 29 TaxID=2973805 RepID=UPI0025B0CB40|nr:phosphopantetheine-binding protein [Streptomyces sp. S.PNR 29]MDN0201110.1 phosphopantetheine-binding protein [Streptomyces sp. S.PNR 29]
MTDVDVDRSYIHDVVLRLVSAYAPVQASEVTTSSVLTEELGYNSLRLVELTFAVEELFELDTLTTAQVQPIQTVGQLQDFVLGLIAEGRCTPPAPDEVEDALRNV